RNRSGVRRGRPRHRRRQGARARLRVGRQAAALLPRRIRPVLDLMLLSVIASIVLAAALIWSGVAKLRHFDSARRQTIALIGPRVGAAVGSVPQVGDARTT